MGKRLAFLIAFLGVVAIPVIAQQKVFRVSLDDVRETCLSEPMIAYRSSIRPAVSVKRVVPYYPDTAKRLNIQSSVTVVFSIDTKGQVINPKVTKGNVLFQLAVLDTISKWEYRPSFLNGRATESKGQVTFNFTLH